MPKKTLLLTLIIMTNTCLMANTVSLDTMIGQMIMVGFNGQYAKDTSIKTLKAQINNGTIGGVIFYKENIISKKQTQSLTKHLKNNQSNYPLLLAIDQEGGQIQRLNKAKGFTNIPAPEDIANPRKKHNAYELYDTMAQEISESGFNLNFGVVVDMNLYTRSPAIGKLKRSYSGNPHTITKFASIMMSKHQIYHVKTAIKHYPGYGSARVDPHFGIPDSSLYWHAMETLPFQWLIKEGNIDMIMSAHIKIDSIDPIYPASLSKIHLTQNLRNKYKFKGVIITDDLMMGAISKYYSLEKRIINAILAGNDILLFGNLGRNPDVFGKKVHAIIKRNVLNGRIPKSKIRHSFSRITALKKSI